MAFSSKPETKAGVTESNANCKPLTVEGFGVSSRLLRLHSSAKALTVFLRSLPSASPHPSYLRLAFQSSRGWKMTSPMPPAAVTASLSTSRWNSPLSAAIMAAPPINHSRPAARRDTNPLPHHNQHLKHLASSATGSTSSPLRPLHQFHPGVEVGVLPAGHRPRSRA